jgi:hypothetical protein
VYEGCTYRPRSFMELVGAFHWWQTPMCSLMPRAFLYSLHSCHAELGSLKVKDCSKNLSTLIPVAATQATRHPCQRHQWQREERSDARAPGVPGCQRQDHRKGGQHGRLHPYRST